MPTNLLDSPHYRRRNKATRTQLFASIWSQLSDARPPTKLGWLFKEHTHIEKEYTGILKRAGLDSVHGVFNSKLGDLVTSGGEKGHEDVSRVQLVDGTDTKTFYIKRFWNRQIGRMTKRAFRGSIVGSSIMCREFKKMKKLQSIGIPTLKLVAYGDQRFCGGVINTFMVTEELPGAVGVDSLAAKWLKQPRDTEKIQQQNVLIEECAHLLKQMHAHGFEHHDLFFRNIMISSEDHKKMYIFDCPRALEWPNWIMNHRRVHDLATLDAAASAVLSSSQRMRFMHTYFGCNQLNTQQKALVTKIIKRADPHRERQRIRLARAV